MLQMDVLLNYEPDRDHQNDTDDVIKKRKKKAHYTESRNSNIQHSGMYNTIST